MLLRRALLASVSIALSLPLSDCILLVHPTTGSLTCAFSGEDSLCGSCVKGECQDEVNACCGDDDCATALSNLDACTTKHGEECTSLEATGSSDAAAAKLASCVRANCLGACQPFTGASMTNCSEPEDSEGTVCNCMLAQSDLPANDFVCSSKVYAGTICCSADGWPAVGLSCECQALSCSTSTSGCFCMLVDYAPNQGTCFSPGVTSCKAEHCCAQMDTCTCGSTPCSEFETAVPQCDIDHVSCPIGQKQFPSCSLLESP
jgi:hypothetical protein